MTKLSELAVNDLRDQISKANWNIGNFTAKQSITLHYNGPAVDDRSHVGEMNQLKFDAQYHIDKVWGHDNDKPVHGDGIMYHFAVLSDGTIVRLRNLSAVLWHCRNAKGNKTSVAIHLPLGGNQDATEPQWQAFGQLCDALIADFNLDGRRVVKGHREWPTSDGSEQSLCPGDRLMARLQSWRSPQTLYEVMFDDSKVREGPGTRFKVALNNTAILNSGDRFMSDKIIFGAPVDGDARWVHRTDGIGFVHLSLLNVVE